MSLSASPLGRRERSKQDKKERIRAAARELFALHGVGTVTTQQIADRADIAIGTLYLYATTKAELLIMVQNQKFATSVDDGLSAAAALKGTLEAVLALLRPVVICVLEHVENGRFYLNELVSGDPAEPYRREGLMLAARLEDGLRALLGQDGRISTEDARMLARVIAAVLHLSITETGNRDRAVDDVMADIHGQIRAVLGQHQPRG